MRPGSRRPNRCLKIKAITYSNNPILPFSNMGMPVHEGQTATALIKGAEIYSELKSSACRSKACSVRPSVSAICAWSRPKIPFMNFARRVAHAVWATKPGLFTYYIVIVEADVDPTNMDEVVHAITTKCHPVEWHISGAAYSRGFPFCCHFCRPRND